MYQNLGTFCAQFCTFCARFWYFCAKFVALCLLSLYTTKTFCTCRIIKDSLLKSVPNVKEEWAKALPGTLFAIRTSKHTSTGYSPFKLMCLREAIKPKSVDILDEMSEDDNNFEKKGAVNRRNTQRNPGKKRKEHR